MIQTGDPSNKGTGSKSVVNNNKPFATEISNQLYHIRGAVSLANSGPMRQAVRNSLLSKIHKQLSKV